MVEQSIRIPGASFFCSFCLSRYFLTQFSHSEDVADRVNLICNDGSLGMKIVFDQNLQCIIVRCFQPLPSGEAGPAERSGLVQPGDVLLMLNSTSVEGLTYSQVLNRIRTARRPLLMKFGKLPKKVETELTTRRVSTRPPAITKFYTRKDLPASLTWSTKRRRQMAFAGAVVAAWFLWSMFTSVRSFSVSPL